MSEAVGQSWAFDRYREPDARVAVPKLPVDPVNLPVSWLLVGNRFPFPTVGFATSRVIRSRPQYGSQRIVPG
jgi:hypothetical protein